MKSFRTKHPKCLLLLIGVSFVWGQPVRQWGFDKDTVYEWYFQRSQWIVADTLSIHNNSNTPLSFDTSTLEILAPNGVFHSATVNLDWYNGGGVVAYSKPFAGTTDLTQLKRITIPRNSRFVMGHTDLIAYKITGPSDPFGMDSLMVRMVFYSGVASGGASDTVYVKGAYGINQCCPTQIKIPVFSKNSVSVRRHRDVQGRKLKPIKAHSVLKLP